MVSHRKMGVRHKNRIPAVSAEDQRLLSSAGAGCVRKRTSNSDAAETRNDSASSVIAKMGPPCEDRKPASTGPNTNETAIEDWSFPLASVRWSFLTRLATAVMYDT